MDEVRSEGALQQPEPPGLGLEWIEPSGLHLRWNSKEWCFLAPHTEVYFVPVIQRWQFDQTLRSDTVGRMWCAAGLHWGVPGVWVPGPCPTFPGSAVQGLALDGGCRTRSSVAKPQMVPVSCLRSCHLPAGTWTTAQVSAVNSGKDPPSLPSDSHGFFTFCFILKCLQKHQVLL